MPSESTLGGKQFAAEFHFVHENGSGKTVVLDVFVAPGAANPAWQPFIDAVGIGQGENDAKRLSIKWASLVPQLKATLQFVGSLTTPPRTEGLTWVVLPTPITMSQAQIDALKAVYDNNIRPVQPLDGRVITADKP